MVFRVLQYRKAEPSVADTPDVGGPDFSCLSGKPQKFMFEATSLLPERVTDQYQKVLAGYRHQPCSATRLGLVTDSATEV